MDSLVIEPGDGEEARVIEPADGDDAVVLEPPGTGGARVTVSRVAPPPAGAHDHERPLGPLLVAGAVRGAVSGLLPGLVGAALVPGRALVLVTVVLASAARLALETASAALPDRGRRARLRFLAGALVGVLVAAPAAGLIGWDLASGAPTGASAGTFLLLGLALGAGFGLAELLAGDATVHPHPGRRAYRNAKVALLAFPFLSLAHFGRGGSALGSLPVLLVVLLADALAFVGDLAAAPLGRRVAAWLDLPRHEGASDELQERRTQALARHEESLRAGDRRGALAWARNALEDARARLEALAVLDPEGAHETARAHVRADALRAAALAFELGALDAVESIVRDLPERDVLRAEERRLAGNRDAARWFLERAPRGGAARAVEASLLADEGRLDEARDLLGRIGAGEERLLERFSVETLRARLERARA